MNLCPGGAQHHCRGGRHRTGSTGGKLEVSLFFLCCLLVLSPLLNVPTCPTGGICESRKKYKQMPKIHSLKFKIHCSIKNLKDLHFSVAKGISPLLQKTTTKKQKTNSLFPPLRQGVTPPRSTSRTRCQKALSGACGRTSTLPRPPRRSRALRGVLTHVPPLTLPM